MIGIITAVAVITSEILLLANTQEIYVGSSSFDDGTTYYWIQNPLIRCLSCFSLFNLQGTLRFAVLHAAVADSLINIAHILQKVKNFFHFPEKIFEPRCAFAPGSQVLGYYIPSTLVCQPVFSVLCIFLSSFPPLVVLFDHKAQFTARLHKSHLPPPPCRCAGIMVS